jgi:hypothetical protein
MIIEKDFQTSARALSYALAGRGLAPDRCLRIMRIFAATIDLNPEDKTDFLVLAMPVPEQGKPPTWMRNLVYGTAVWVDHTIEVLQRLEKSGSRRGAACDRIIHPCCGGDCRDPPCSCCSPFRRPLKAFSRWEQMATSAATGPHKGVEAARFRLRKR